MMLKRPLKFLVCFCLILVSATAVSQDETASDDEKSKIFKDQFTTIKNPFELRDPFRRKSFRSAKRIGLGKDYSYSNLPELKPFTLDQLKIVGIFFGKKRRAVAKIGNASNTFILKEGMKIGDNQAEIKAIMPGGIVVVERIRNVYDQEEVLETIIPLSAAIEK